MLNTNVEMTKSNKSNENTKISSKMKKKTENTNY